MSSSGLSASAKVRARLDHPVIDADGHFLELLPVMQGYSLDYVRQIGGARMAEKFAASGGLTYDRMASQWHRTSAEERRDSWTTMANWWVLPTRNSLDRATGYLPRLLHQRLDDFGIDFAVLYPTMAMTVPGLEDEELRRVGCRALNSYHAELFAELSDRMTPVAVIPMHTPREAIDELEHAVNVLGLKATMVNGRVNRPVPSLGREYLEVAARATHLETFGIDSEHDYDPVWEKCLELKVAPSFHAGTRGFGSRQSISNFVYNHVGHFADGGEALCKSLFLGGVTRRFPGLRFAFLEGGVGWACALYAGLAGDWAKRNVEVLADVDPANLDVDLLMDKIDEYGGEAAKARRDEIRAFFDDREPPPPSLDDWAACRIEHEEQLRDLFVPHFYFGCEADDPLTSLAFNTRVNPFGARLRPMFGSDIGHFDVPDMEQVLHEAHEPVEKGIMTEADFRDFVFTNPVRFYAARNDDFFQGTRCEAQAAQVIAADRSGKPR